LHSAFHSSEISETVTDNWYWMVTVGRYYCRF